MWMYIYIYELSKVYMDTSAVTVCMCLLLVYTCSRSQASYIEGVDFSFIPLLPVCV